jgi:hypothetical protein
VVATHAPYFLRNWLSASELQWQSRGTRPLILQGCSWGALKELGNQAFGAKQYSAANKVRNEKCQFRTEKCQFRTEKFQFRTEKCQFRTER